MRSNYLSFVMPALVAGIHVSPLPTLPRVRGRRVGGGRKQDVDGRDKPAMAAEKRFNMIGTRSGRSPLLSERHYEHS
jgi:hypothetical protein